MGVQAFAGGCHLTELTGFIGHNFTEPEQVLAGKGTILEDIKRRFGI